jgi:hypothetical protein
MIVDDVVHYWLMRCGKEGLEEAGGKGGDILAHDRVRRPSPLFGRFTPFAVDVFCSQG